MDEGSGSQISDQQNTFDTDEVHTPSESNNNDQQENEVPTQQTHLNLTKSNVIEACERMSKLSEMLSSERVSSDLLSSFLSTSEGNEHKEAHSTTSIELNQMLPSLNPRERLKMTISTDALHTSEFLVHASILQRLKKIMIAPNASLHCKVIDSLGDETQLDKDVIMGSPTDWNAEITDRLRQLEINLAQEIQILWKEYGIIEPNGGQKTENLSGPLVNAHFKEDIHKNELDIPNSKEALDTLIPVINAGVNRYCQYPTNPSETTPQLTTTQDTSTTLSQIQSNQSQPHQSQCIIPAGTVLTLNYEVVKSLVQRGIVNLIG